MIIYVEVIWLLNLLLDWMLLLLTQSVTKHETKWYRLFLAGLFGSLIVPITFIFPDVNLHSLWIKVCYSLIMIWIAFPFRNLAYFGKSLFSFYFMTFAIGGGLIAIHFLLSAENHASQPYLASHHIHGLFVLIGFPIVFFFTKYRMDHHRMQQFQQQFFYKVTIQWSGKLLCTTGYLDSGNHLVDPLSHHPVIMVDEGLLSQWMDQEEIYDLRTASQSFGETDLLQAKHFQWIPYQGVSGEQQMMLAFKPDYLKVELPNQTITTSKVLIGIQFGHLVADGSYHCLLHPKLFQQAG
ncbi:sigma-E processing peptidase SpoIIGA [Gracilibacillus alcaliphilus]|uniref:sigma-E processing peptidase SpoIIGA n=1 Tax=Gracilibacillus alcaliphilus TaxID=1401441 RepID=UPI00195DA324|nr:stage II sporulation protein GA (sporulation sigma-E factor processing peptidase) [Gracilibacillus alcaliphilus]